MHGQEWMFLTSTFRTIPIKGPSPGTKSLIGCVIARFQGGGAQQPSGWFGRSPSFPVPEPLPQARRSAAAATAARGEPCLGRVHACRPSGPVKDNPLENQLAIEQKTRTRATASRLQRLKHVCIDGQLLFVRLSPIHQRSHRCVRSFLFGRANQSKHASSTASPNGFERSLSHCGFRSFW